MEEKLPSTEFQPGHEKTGGRQPGVRNRTTRILKEAIMTAAELEGSDGEGKDGLIGFLRRVATEDIRAFASLLGRVIPFRFQPRATRGTRWSTSRRPKCGPSWAAQGITF